MASKQNNVAARPRVDKLDEYSQGMALREAAKCWRILDTVAKRLCLIVKTSVTKSAFAFVLQTVGGRTW